MVRFHDGGGGSWFLVGSFKGTIGPKGKNKKGNIGRWGVVVEAKKSSYLALE